MFSPRTLITLVFNLDKKVPIHPSKYFFFFSDTMYAGQNVDVNSINNISGRYIAQQSTAHGTM